MAPPSAAVSFKKKDGSLSLTEDEATLVWTPAEASVPGHHITVSTITSMQPLNPAAQTRHLC